VSRKEPRDVEVNFGGRVETAHIGGDDTEERHAAQDVDYIEPLLWRYRRGFAGKSRDRARDWEVQRFRHETIRMEQNASVRKGGTDRVGWRIQ